MIRRNLLFVGMFATMLGCGVEPSGSNDSNLDVTNGIEIEESDFPAVVKLDIRIGFIFPSICTGTFVSDSQLVTAAHCVALATRIEVDGVRADDWVRQPDYSILNNGGVNEYDLAVVTFPEGTAKEFVSIAEQAPMQGDAIELVGYGNNIVELVGGTIGGSGAGVKRYGKNVISEPVPGVENMLSIVGISKAGDSLNGETVELGEAASSGSGDSGGPLLFNGELAGVVSGGGIAESESGETLGIGIMTDLQSELSQAFLKEHLFDY